MTWNWVEPNVLAAGSIPTDAVQIRELHASGIRSILTLTERPLTAMSTIGGTLFKQLDIDYRHVPIPDQFPPDNDQADEIIRYIDAMKAQGRPLYFHCHAGIGRTGTAMHLYFLAQGLPLNQAKARISGPTAMCVADRSAASLCRTIRRPTDCQRCNDCLRLFQDNNRPNYQTDAACCVAISGFRGRDAIYRVRLDWNFATAPLSTCRQCPGFIQTAGRVQAKVDSRTKAKFSARS
jgi:protein tyrosine phosphatase (PTP) superfamily phosphohydrolase (DUF442 family)